jgi:UDP-N-acetylglucosamine transferase subunit ALG13
MTAPAPAEARNSASPRIVVTVGTDHHPFDRLISWTNDWLSRYPEQVPGFFVQAGPASVVPACPGSQFLDVSQLDTLLDAADVIVCHGGPGCIADAWARGRVPIVVPRLPRLGEIVDGHQVDFCRKLAELQRIRLAQTPAEFASLLDEATRDQARFRSSEAATDVAAAVTRFGEFVEELVSHPRRRRPRRHRIRPTSNQPVTGPLAVAAHRSPGPASQPGPSWNNQGGQARAGLRGLANEEQE